MQTGTYPERGARRLCAIATALHASLERSGEGRVAIIGRGRDSEEERTATGEKASDERVEPLWGSERQVVTEVRGDMVLGGSRLFG